MLDVAHDTSARLEVRRLATASWAGARRQRWSRRVAVPHEGSTNVMRIWVIADDHQPELRALPDIPRLSQQLRLSN